MIAALRKIEGRGELAGATSAVMEMCVDNPREGFTDLFSTHPSIEARIKALVDVMGGHDPGPLALPVPQEEAAAVALPRPTGPWGGAAEQPPQPGAPSGGPRGHAPAEPAEQRPFLPDRPPIDLGAPPVAPSSGDGPAGPGGKPGR
jgi:heat shock protein HtpX